MKHRHIITPLEINIEKSPLTLSTKKYFVIETILQHIAKDTIDLCPINSFP